MLKSGLKAVGSISKAGKTKNVVDVMKAGSDTAKVVDKVTMRRKKKTCKC